MSKNKKKKPAKTTEQMPKEAIAQADKNIAAIEKHERQQKPSKPASKTTKAAKAAKPQRAKRRGILDIAAEVLGASKEPMTCADIVKVALDKQMWSTHGKTPSATLYAAILREIQKKKDQARFKKVDRGMFAFSGKRG